MSRLKQYLFAALVLLGIGPLHADGLDQAQVSLFKVQLSLAQSGDPEGEYYVGEMYEKGLGTPQNLQLAHEWYEKAAKQGNAKAKAKLIAWDTAVKDAQKAKDEAKEKVAAEAAAKEKARAAAAAEKTKEIAAQKAKEKAAARQKAMNRPGGKTRQDAVKVSKNPKTQGVAAATPKPAAHRSASAVPEFSANPCKGPSARFLSTCQ